MNSDNATGYNITSEEEEYVNPGMSLRLYISGFLIRLVQTFITNTRLPSISGQCCHNPY